MGWGPATHSSGSNLDDGWKAESVGRQARAVCGTEGGRDGCASKCPGSPASSVSGMFDEKLRNRPLTARTVGLSIISLAERCISCMHRHASLSPLLLHILGYVQASVRLQNSSNTNLLSCGGSGRGKEEKRTESS